MKRINIIRCLALLAFVLTLLDAVCTAAGISIGVITEGNPIFRDIMNKHPVWTASIACLYTGALLLLLYRLSTRSQIILPLLISLCTVKTAVIAMHIGWIVTLY